VEALKPTARRSALCVPGDRIDRVRKALASAADEVIIDLEDAVAPGAKSTARDRVCELLTTLPDVSRLGVRINALGSSWWRADVAALNRARPDLPSLVVPKVQRGSDLADVEALLPSRGTGLQALVETAEGLHRVDEIAGSSTRLRTVIIGYADLAADLQRAVGAGGNVAWLPVQHALLLAARRHGIQAIDGPSFNFRDTTDCRAANVWAAQLGFDGKWAIHPSQVDDLNDAFTPSEAETRRARAIVDAFEAAMVTQSGAVGVEGVMLDQPVYDAAIQLLARASRTEGGL
jgi:citrate lyase beta subunit